MQESPREIDALLDEAYSLDDSPPKVALLEEAVRLADAHGSIPLAFDVRQQLISSATMCGQRDKALVAFTWCLAQHDRQPDQYDETELLWQYKWVAHALTGFPDITRQQILGVFDDMTRRYLRAGYSLRPVLKLRCQEAIDRGDRETAQKYHAEWQATARDFGNDCAACELDDEMDYLLFLGEDAAALDRARPLLAGKMRCSEIPHSTLAEVLPPLVRLGRWEEAMTHHRKGLRMVSRNRGFVEEIAKHITFLVLTDNLGPASRLLQRHLVWALEAPQADRRFGFYLAARLLCERLHETGQSPVSLRLPRSFAGWVKGGKYDPPALAGWFDGELRSLAEAFDRRNESDWFARRNEQHRSWKEMVRPMPV